MSQNRLKKNPSRETCESIIRRILTSEIRERGRNKHFRQARDFMPYFESLYPASDSLTKQVQRAVKTLNLPRDENGYFIINKSTLQEEQERELMSYAASCSLIDCETVFLEVQPSYVDYLLHLIAESESFTGLYVTMHRTCNGIIFYTRDKLSLLGLLKQLEPNDN